MEMEKPIDDDEVEKKPEEKPVDSDSDDEAEKKPVDSDSDDEAEKKPKKKTEDSDDEAEKKPKKKHKESKKKSDTEDEDSDDEDEKKSEKKHKKKSDTEDEDSDDEDEKKHRKSKKKHKKKSDTEDEDEDDRRPIPSLKPKISNVNDDDENPYGILVQNIDRVKITEKFPEAEYDRNLKGYIIQIENNKEGKKRKDEIREWVKRQESSGGKRKRCKGTTTRGQPCSRYGAGGTSYCHDHDPELVASRSRSKSKAPLCKGISVRTGKRCGHTTTNPNGYCSHHQNQAGETSPKRSRGKIEIKSKNKTKELEPTDNYIITFRFNSMRPGSLGEVDERQLGVIILTPEHPGILRELFIKKPKDFKKVLLFGLGGAGKEKPKIVSDFDVSSGLNEHDFAVEKEKKLKKADFKYVE